MTSDPRTMVDEVMWEGGKVVVGLSTSATANMSRYTPAKAAKLLSIMAQRLDCTTASEQFLGPIHNIFQNLSRALICTYIPQS